MAVDSLVKRLTDERDTKVTLIGTLADRAEDEGRDLYPTDLETIKSARSRILELDSQIDAISADLEMAESVRTRVRALDPAVVGRDFTYRTAGDYLWDAFHLTDNPDAAARWSKYHKRAAEHMGLDKANTIPVAGGFNGLVVPSVAGAVLDPSPTGRPLLTALGVRPAPGMQFSRPRVVDPNLATGVGAIGQEKSELPSKAWDIVNEPVTLSRVGGYINISELLIEMLAGSLDMIVRQMNHRLEYYCEHAVVTELDKTTEIIPLTAAATGAEVTAAIGQASATVFANTGSLPTYLAMGPTAYGRLVGMSDLAGRPLFSAVNPVNALGSGDANTFITSLAGMSAVVSYAITDSDMFVGNAFGLEVYERKLPILQAVEPSVFGRQLSVQTALGFYAPITTEGATPARDGVVHIDWA
jgi:hypothetical protein